MLSPQNPPDGQVVKAPGRFPSRRSILTFFHLQDLFHFDWTASLTEIDTYVEPFVDGEEYFARLYSLFKSARKEMHLNNPTLLPCPLRYLSPLPSLLFLLFCFFDMFCRLICGWQLSDIYLLRPFTQHKNSNLFYMLNKAATRGVVVSVMLRNSILLYLFNYLYTIYEYKNQNVN